VAWRVRSVTHFWRPVGTRFCQILRLSLLGFWSVVCLFPLYWIAITSLKDEAAIINGPLFLPYFDFSPSLAAWDYVLFYPNVDLFGRFLNSAIIGLSATVLTLVIGGFSAYGLTRFRFALPWLSILLGFLLLVGAVLAVQLPVYRRAWLPAIVLIGGLVVTMRYFRWRPTIGNRGLLTVLFSTRMLPPLVIVLPLYLSAQFTGILDTWFILILVYTAINLLVAVLLLLAVFGNEATDYEEAAQLEGASRVRVFLEIFVPTVASRVAAVGLAVFILCWTEYLFAAYLAGDQAMTLPPWVVGQISMKEAQVGGDQVEWARFSAAAVLMVLPPLVAITLTLRFLGKMAFWKR